MIELHALFFSLPALGIYNTFLYSVLVYLYATMVDQPMDKDSEVMSEGDLKAFSAMVSPDHNMNLITLTSKDTSSPHGDGTAAHLPLSVAKSRPNGHVTTSTNIRCTVHNMQVAQAKEDTGEGTVDVYESQGGLKPSTLASIYVISPDPDEFSCSTEFSMDTGQPQM